MIADDAGGGGAADNWSAKAPLCIFLPHNSNGQISGMCFLYFCLYFYQKNSANMYLLLQVSFSFDC